MGGMLRPSNTPTTRTVCQKASLQAAGQAGQMMCKFCILRQAAQVPRRRLPPGPHMAADHKPSLPRAQLPLELHGRSASRR